MMTCDFAEKFVSDTQEDIRIFLTIFDSILTFLRISLKLRKERAEIAN